MDFRELLNRRKYIVLDGAMGTMLQARGLKLGGIPEELNMTNPDMIKEIHRLYIEAGSDIIYTNTFGGNGYKLAHSVYSVEEIIKSGVSLAKEVCLEYEKDDIRPLAALDIGPIGQLLEPTGSLSFEKAYEYYKEQIIAGQDADLIVFETMTDLLELKAAILAARENSGLPIMCTMTFEQNLRTFTGTSIESMAVTLESLNADAIGVNCSLGPKELLPVVKRISEYTSLPLIVKANAGLPDPVTNTYSITPEEFSDYMLDMAPYGVKIFGGCCGTDQQFIKTMSKALKEYDFSNIAGRQKKETIICSQLKAVNINEPRIIGERINPTGKKKFKEALINNDIDYILNQAIEQVEAGAEILDVNVGLPGINEKSMMVRVIKELQAVVDVPLQIDSTIPEVLEAALRVYNGKPIVNSVNGEEKSMEAILPVIKKYGACVVCLTLDEGGIPKKADDRIKIAEKIMNRAMEYGIPRENLIIDCLTLTASAEQDGVEETLQAVEAVKNKLKLKTVLGVSNISFGLPNRELINHTFLTMALERGLDLPIMNPNVTSMTGAFRAFKLLKGYDRDSSEFIQNYGAVNIKTIVTKPGEAVQIKGNKGEVNTDKKYIENIHEYASGKDSSREALRHAMENGLKAEGTKYTKELLEAGVDSMEIVNEILIPALDKIGTLFEQGKVYLPQLILSAGVAQNSFEVIKSNMLKSDTKPVSKGKIVLATVKGDIHDIGKNIVKVLLENYGYTVIDLGKDVDYQTVVDAAIEHKVKLVGLSALMTTTLVSMEETIKLLRKNNVDCKIVVGGAVLTPEYAKQIGADFYAKDAKESVDIAKKVIGE
ncbi:MAG: homocysteine S-methyltransferase family protein [Lachnospiraceae bacterium]